MLWREDLVAIDPTTHEVHFLFETLFHVLTSCTFCSWLYGLLPEKKQLNAWKGHLMTLLLQVILYDTKYSVRYMYLVQVNCMPQARKNWKESNVFPWHFGRALCKKNRRFVLRTESSVWSKLQEVQFSSDLSVQFHWTIFPRVFIILWIF